VETELIDWLQKRIAPSQHLPVGIGDDAAVLEVPHSGPTAIATDMLMDGAHFVLNECGATRAGHKALGVNLSDLAAMAAKPLAAFVSLALPRGDALAIGRQIIEGMLPLAGEFGCVLAGGDTNVWSGPVVINVAVVGTIGKRGALTRSGARPGDWILVTGACGGSLLGRHLDMVPRVREAIQLHEQYRLHAGIDVSDGLSQDLWRVAEASRCGAVLDLQSVPIHPDAVLAAEQAPDGRSPLDHALGDGEDFELILAVPPEDAKRIVREQPLGVPITLIGEFVDEQGLWSKLAGGARQPLAPIGFEHK
jgi:thiamine-monophosphate kinase